MTTCVRCNAPVRYIDCLDEVDCEPIALDVPPVQRYVVRTDNYGVYASGRQFAALTDVYTAHCDTCPAQGAGGGLPQ